MSSIIFYSTASQGSLFIDSSTIDPSVSQEMAEIASEKGITFMDAPVSGGMFHYTFIKHPIPQYFAYLLDEISLLDTAMCNSKPS